MKDSGLMINYMDKEYKIIIKNYSLLNTKFLKIFKIIRNLAIILLIDKI